MTAFLQAIFSVLQQMTRIQGQADLPGAPLHPPHAVGAVAAHVFGTEKANRLAPAGYEPPSDLRAFRREREI